MNEITTCERAPDLIAFLYDEANESEKRDFEFHLKDCAACGQEVASFGVVRESITAWRDEALSGFVSMPVDATVRKKSAIAALRQFFDLSPLWLKGATGFGVLALCVLAAFAVVNMNRSERTSIAANPNAVYTQQDVDRLVKDAQESSDRRQPIAQSPKQAEEPIKVAQSTKHKRAGGPGQVARSRRPLTRAEREQLAADLRLLSTDDGGLNLLGDRINH